MLYKLKRKSYKSTNKNNIIPFPQYIVAVAAWAAIHTVLWDGKAERTEDLPIPFQIMGLLFGKDPVDTTFTLNKKSDDVFQTEFDPKAPTEMEKLYYGDNEVDTVQEKFNKNTLGSVSVNGLYNFLTRPKTSAFNLLLALGFVSQNIIAVHFAMSEYY